MDLVDATISEYGGWPIAFLGSVENK
jgi:hypothetical protein